MSVPVYTNGPLPGAHLVVDDVTGLPVYQEQASALFTVSTSCVIDFVLCVRGMGGGGLPVLLSCSALVNASLDSPTLVCVCTVRISKDV